MSKINFMIAMGHIDDRILDRYIQEDQRLSTSTPFVKRPWVRITALAACLALIVAGIFLPKAPLNNDPAISMTVTMDDVLSVIPQSLDSTPTSFYSKITLPNGQLPSFLPLPERNTLPVYKNNRIHIPLDKAAFSRFAFITLNGLAAAFGTDAPQYTITNKTLQTLVVCQEYNYPFDLFSCAYLKGQCTLGDFDVDFNQSGSIYSLSMDNHRKLPQSFNGKPLTIDPSLDDTQILASLESVKQKMFDIFDEDYPNTMITRSNSFISVFFYDAEDTVNHWVLESSGIHRPITNYISLSFEIESDKTTPFIDQIRYVKSLVDSNEIYTTINTPTRTLEEAEEWLNKGYVFGGYGCPICMAQQMPVDFEDYDFVGIQYLHKYEYLFGGSLGRHINVAIPFYVFYKVIETTDTATTYAYTYVPAIEVEGMEEYFAEKHSHHNP